MKDIEIIVTIDTIDILHSTLPFSSTFVLKPVFFPLGRSFLSLAFMNQRTDLTLLNSSSTVCKFRFAIHLLN